MPSRGALHLRDDITRTDDNPWLLRGVEPLQYTFHAVLSDGHASSCRTAAVDMEEDPATGRCISRVVCDSLPVAPMDSTRQVVVEHHGVVVLPAVRLQMFSPVGPPVSAMHAMRLEHVVGLGILWVVRPPVVAVDALVGKFDRARFGDAESAQQPKGPGRCRAAVLNAMGRAAHTVPSDPGADRLHDANPCARRSLPPRL